MSAAKNTSILKDVKTTQSMFLKEEWNSVSVAQETVPCCGESVS